VRRYLQEQMDQVSLDSRITAERVINELAKIAFADLQMLLAEDGKILPLEEIDPALAAAISEYDETTRTTKAGVVITRRIKLHPKLEALDKLMRYFGLYERDNVSKSEFILWAQMLLRFVKESVGNPVEVDAIRRKMLTLVPGNMLQSQPSEEVRHE